MGVGLVLSDFRFKLYLFRILRTLNEMVESGVGYGLWVSNIMNLTIN